MHSRSLHCIVSCTAEDCIASQFTSDSVQVRTVGEQLVNVGGSHGWGPSNLSDEQVWQFCEGGC